MITIKVNQENHQFSEKITLQNLVEQLQISTKGIAIAINNNVIQKENWISEHLRNNDNVLIIKSTQGG